jgi:hypoxanthine phosphoribosyltransferase
MNQIKLHDKTFELFISAEKINRAIEEMAIKMNSDLAGKNPLFISILNGAFMFTSDLMKKLDFDCNLTFLKLSSYQGTSSTGEVKKLIGLNENIEGRTVIIIEDIVDTGITLEHIMKQLDELKPSEIKIATFLLKPDTFNGRFKPEYIGIEVPNDFIVGYGLDYNELGRNLKDIYVLVKS